MVSTHDERYQAFLRRLREARLAASLSQEAAARMLGRPQSYISRSESGERRVDVVELTEFAHLYAVDIRLLLGHETSHSEGDESGQA